MQLVINDLRKCYPNGVQALNGVSLQINKGMFGLLGPNGAGKSSLMRTISTLQDADSGSIKFGEIDVLSQKEEVRRLLGYLPQDFGVYPRVSADTMLHHIAALKGINNKKERKEIVEALLHKVNLYNVRHKNLGTYSGGMRQRFGIAQAMIGNPQLIIVDEPTAGLDPTERVRFHNLLSEIGENAVVILSTHIVEDVSHLCTNMAVICGGEVMLQGEPKKIISSMQGKIWKKVVEKHEAKDYASRMKVISTNLLGGKTMLHVYSESLPESGFSPIDADLEDVYFHAISSKVNLVML
ncbi:ABC transporter ATP-binding protein [Chitinophaga silvatica]|uniref:ABC transporter ATP-binding protein n=1 Tax=Chitinophaga silvatica TaxID=2282649 RepID=A0A3E1YE15_9BACT|nr:ABC transporter ATP-binding protein [Chitinophaga silvatica]RFS24724.1 ABC transporter ATP-binding protein [Chitinophaga silvatica]